MKDKRNSRAVTLIELLAVITIVALVMAVAVPGIKFFVKGSRLSAGAKKVADTLSFARQLAITNRYIYGVQFKPAENEYRIFFYDRNDPNKNNPDDGITVDKWNYLPTSIQFASAPNEVEFKPTGGVSGGSAGILIMDKDSGKRRTITVINVTGRVRVKAE